MIKPAAFLLIKTRRSARQLAQQLDDTYPSSLQWTRPVYGPFQLVSYLEETSNEDLSAIIEDLREHPDVTELDARMCKPIPEDRSLQSWDPRQPEVAALLINVDFRQAKEREVTCRLREIPGVIFARAMWGPSDIMAVVEATSGEEMRNIICDGVKVLKGVSSNTTLYGYPARAPVPA